MHKTGPVFFMSIIIAVVFILDWYTFQGIKLLTANFGSRLLKRSIYITFWTICITVPITLVYGIMTMQKNNGMSHAATWAFNALLTMLITELVVVLFLFSEDLYRILHGIVSWIRSSINDSPSTNTSFLPSRRKFITQIALIVASIPFASFVYGVSKGKYRYKVHKHILRLKDLPDAFDGFKIVQLSDIHVGSFDDRQAVEHGIDLVNEQKGDLFVFTGDFVNNVASELEPWKDVFAKIKTPHGQFSILGNHDYGDYKNWASDEEKHQNLRTLMQHQKDIGFRLLMDEHVNIEKNGQQISLIGIQNWGHGFAQYGNLDKALHGIDPKSIKVLLSHDPSHFDHQVKTHPTHIHLTLSGHTHGMQMGFEFKHFRWSPSKWRYPKWAGLYHENERYINVNRGFGFIGFSGRVGIWPEVSVIELRKG